MKQTIKCKAMLRIAGVIALTAIIGASFIACDDGSGNGSSSGSPFNGTWINDADATDIITITSPNWIRTKGSPLSGILDYESAPSPDEPNIRTSSGGSNIGWAEITGGKLYWEIYAVGPPAVFSKGTSGSNSGDSVLSGNITISPSTGVTTGTTLTAAYSGTETVSYQWKLHDVLDLGTAQTQVANQAGSYTVTVSAAGFQSKTSEPVTVGNPSWPTELLGSWTFPPNNPNNLSINFYDSVGGGGATSYASITGFSTGLRLVSITGKTIVLSENRTLCTNYTITGNTLVLTGGDADFDNVTGVTLTKWLP